MKIITIISALLLVFINANAEAVSAAMRQSASATYTLEDARAAVLEEDFDKAIYVYSSLIETQQKKRSQGTQVDNTLLGEYAFVLGIVGAQQAAIINIDLALNLETPDKAIYYYTGSVLSLTGFKQYAEPFFQVGKEPAWLQGRGEELNRRFAAPTLLNVKSSRSAIEHVTLCMNDSRYIEALCYCTYLTELDPQDKSARLLQSAVLEKLDCYSLALESYKQGILLFEDSEQQGLTKQLEYLQQKAEENGNEINLQKMQRMVYGGLTYTSSYFSINGRYGASWGRYSASINASLSFPYEGESSSYTGLSIYYNVGKLFTGIGVGFQSTGSQYSFNFSPTIGLSFLNSKRTSSFDISLSWNIPCKSGADSTVAISIGKTFYFSSK